MNFLRMPASTPATTRAVATGSLAAEPLTPRWLEMALPMALSASLVATPLWTLLVFAPVVEEIVFRGGLQEALLRCVPHGRSASAWPANVLTAITFAGVHAALNPGAGAWLTALPAWLVGCVYQRHRRLLPCIALHALFNALWLLQHAV